MMIKVNKIYKYFDKNEISEIKPEYYPFIKRNKLIVFVPSSHLDKLTFDLGNKGAGIIGNYDLCSFRVNGSGTYRPNSKANPYYGKLNKFTITEEVRLEMEFDKENTNILIDALLESHPYEEPAYEIYEFSKRSKEPSGYYIKLKNQISLNELVSRFNRKDIIPLSKKKLNQFIYIVNTEIDNEIKNIAILKKYPAVISERENKINIIII